MKSFLLSTISFCTLCSVFFFPLAAGAQTTIGLSSSDIAVSIDPESPGPNQQVNVQIDSFATDLNAASITWYVNNKKVASGTGDKSISFTTGSLGQQTDISIVISSLQGNVTDTFSVIPSSVDMMWEADTYTPPFFKGKPLFTVESDITFIAVPHIMKNGKEIPPQNLIYTWSENDTVLGSLGGYGKDTLTLQSSLVSRPMDVTVSITDPQSDADGQGEISVSPGQPLIVMYKNDPLYGIQYEKALQGSYSMSEKEVSLTAVPYYFSAASLIDPVLTYAWQLNGNPITDGVNAATKVFRNDNDITGTSNISVAVSNSQQDFQFANQTLSISFQKTATQSIF